MNRLLASSLFVIAMSLTNFTTALAEEPPSNVRVMSFNIRYGTASDGENHWNRRKDFVVETIRTFDPDLLGTQETLGFQRDFLAEHLPGYEVLGVGRDDGKEGGEMMALYFKRNRFDKLDGGHFWLSETPDKVGSKSWDSSLPRMVTWVKLRDQHRRDGLPLTFFNTHFDHQGRTARLESAKLLRQRAAAAKDSLCIITGDFNSGDGSPPYRALFEKVGETASPVVDSFRVKHPERGESEGTFSGFDPKAQRGDRIDWIGVSPAWEVFDASIDRTVKEGRTPSDHFPVMAILRRD